MVAALTSAMYRLVECLDEVNTVGDAIDPMAIDEAAAEIWLHLAKALNESHQPWPGVN